MKKKSLLFSIVVLAVASCGAPAPVAEWTEGPADENGKACHTLVLKNVPGGSRVWFQELYDNHISTPEAQATILHFQGTSFYIDIPENAGAAVCIPYTGRPLRRHSWAPEGFLLQQKGKEARPMEVCYTFLEHPSTPQDPSWYNAEGPLGATDLIPRPKMQSWEGENSRPEGWYRITIKDGKPQVDAADDAGKCYAKTTLSKMGSNLPDGTIEDWPDMPFRGLMLDISREFRPLEDIKKVVDILALYKANVLHLHIGDDEAWALEIKALPELTSFSGRHVLPGWDLQETEGLKPGAAGRLEKKSFLSQEEYMDLLRYCADRGICVVPEFDAPGHSRAAIKAMQQYEKRTGDGTYRLQDPADTSRYWSAQDFTDNVLSVELPGVYAFFGVVFDEVMGLHKKAGVPLMAIHIGGDEVPHGAWAGKDRIAQKNLFTNGILEVAEARGVRLAGWQDVAMDLYPETLERLKRSLAFVHAWTELDRNQDFAYQLADAGVPVVICNVNCAYIDLAYSDAPQERGLDWGGFVDERRSFALQPWNLQASLRWNRKGDPQDVSALQPATLAHPENILGVEACLWGEHLRSMDHTTYQILPKALGIFERGWNDRPLWPSDAAFKEDFRQFYHIIKDREMPLWDNAGYCYKKR